MGGGSSTSFSPNCHGTSASTACVSCFQGHNQGEELSDVQPHQMHGGMVIERQAVDTSLASDLEKLGLQPNSIVLQDADVGLSAKESQCGSAGEEAQTPMEVRPNFLAAAAKVVPDGKERTRAQSWSEFPAHMRGMSLRELWQFYEKNKAFIEKPRWRCGKCRKSAEEDVGPCPFCGHDEGEVGTRNLYEINRGIIKPTCQARALSYVELLMEQRSDKAPIAADVFVSHWWGEEFKTTIDTLDHYARTRQSAELPWMRVAVAYSVISITSPILIAILAVACGFQDVLDAHPFNVFTLINLLVIVIFMVIFTKCFRGYKMKNYLDTSFWICAFANNQFAVDHAMPLDNDAATTSFALALQGDSVKEMVAILDKEAMIYSRIWCVFELFFTKCLLPARFKRVMDIAIANDRGLVSDGDSSEDTLWHIRKMLEDIRISEAKASNPNDKTIILRSLEGANVQTEDLERELRQIAKGGLLAARLRRKAPWVYAICPFLSISTVLIVRSGFAAYEGKEMIACPIIENPQLHTIGSLIGFSLLSPALCFILCKLVLTHHWLRTTYRLRFLRRALFVAGAVAMPGLILEVSCTGLFDMEEMGYTCGFMWEWLFISMFSLCFAGIVYSIVRDMERFSALRRYVEMALFA
mmetsp:Transcript_11029/g.25225  ORF Transcript_11029/g.25225 Transcript_11029/m.25225 type:complete len:640 (-) Transcript_11029:101-2020(-)